jgi:DNA-binding CsgD family transcriptional regulator
MAPTSADLWRALHSGLLSVVGESCGGVRHYALTAHPPEARVRRALEPRVVQALERLVGGAQFKVVAADVQLSVSRLSRLVGGAARQLGFETAFEAVHVLGAVLGEPDPDLSHRLSAGERDVLRLVQGGLSNREIASRRGRSEHTVANQVAALLRKTGLPGRRALAACVALPPGDGGPCHHPLTPPWAGAARARCFLAARLAMHPGAWMSQPPAS